MVNEVYVNPRVENVIVGFSGIDPDEKGSSLSDEQLGGLLGGKPKTASSPSGGGGSSGEIFGGLPSIEPPAWEIHNFPYYNSNTQYKAYSAVHTMYYGKSCAAKNGTPQTGLLSLWNAG